MRAAPESRRIASRPSTARLDRRVAAARLAEVLSLDPAVDLSPSAPELSVWPQLDAYARTDAKLIAVALENRPELKAATLSAEAAATDHDSARFGAWLPSVGARASFFGLGGGQDDALGRFGDGRDYAVGLRWRIGPGGVFDTSRSHAGAARSLLADLDRRQSIERVKREVVEASARARALEDQRTMAERMLESAEEVLRLSRERRAFGVGAVLETLSAEEELTRTRLEYVDLVAEASRAQLALEWAVGNGR